MASFVLTDLCFPAALGEPHVVAEAAAAAGVQSVLYVCDDPDTFPDLQTIDDIAANPTLATLRPAVSVRGDGFGYVVIAPDWTESPLLSALGEMNDCAAIETAAHEAGGCAIPVCPRQGPDGHVHRDVTLPGDVSRVGSVAYVAGGSHLGRDLDVEDARAANRRVLSGTGPYGTLEDLGRFGTLFPVPPGDLAALLDALRRGMGLALEVGATGQARPPKKKRRRRKRKPRNRGGSSPQSEPAAE